MTARDEQPAESAEPRESPLFEAFEWVPTRLRSGPYDLLSDVRDIVGGVATAMQMIESSRMNVENGDAPLLGVQAECSLQRMSIAAMRCVELRVANHLEYMNCSGGARVPVQREKEDTAPGAIK